MCSVVVNYINEFAESYIFILLITWTIKNLLELQLKLTNTFILP